MNADQKRMSLAIVLSAIVLITWQFLIAPEHVDTSKSDRAANVQRESRESSEPEQRSEARQNQEIKKAESSSESVESAPREEIEKQSLVLKNEKHYFKFNNALNVENITNSEAVFDFTSIAGTESPFQIRLLTTGGSELLMFEMSESSERSLKGYNEQYDITFQAELLENGRLDFHLTAPQEYRYRFVFNSTPKENGNNMVREFIYYTKDVSRESVGEATSGDGHFKWFGLDYNYHLFAFVLENKSRIRYEMTDDARFIIDSLDGTSNFHGDLIFTKKNYDLLSNLGDNLHLSVDFGLFGIIAVPILRGLEMFYNLIPNYGVAIILLTLLIRLLTFPLQYKSFKSMKKMQKIQPELQKVREKYKEDPQKLQKETMELFKKSGANPLGGCLPLLAQMPIFFAFYQVLYNAVELVGAPFTLWIVDLSIKDPYYVLPVLMGASLFLQMRLNPTPTTDPMQKKVMMFMPLIFLFIMKDLPAGLNLYIFVSTVFGIAQQLFVYKMTD